MKDEHAGCRDLPLRSWVRSVTNIAGVLDPRVPSEVRRWIFFAYLYPRADVRIHLGCTHAPIGTSLSGGIDVPAI